MPRHWFRPFLVSLSCNQSKLARFAAAEIGRCPDRSLGKTRGCLRVDSDRLTAPPFRAFPLIHGPSAQTTRLGSLYSVRIHSLGPAAFFTTRSQSPGRLT